MGAPIRSINTPINSVFSSALQNHSNRIPAASSASSNPFPQTEKKILEKRTPRAMASIASRCGVTFSLEAPCEEQPRHSLDACFLCRRPLRASSDVFMYRGDTPFCSEECRQEQIDLDEAREREIRNRRTRHHHRRPSPVERPASSADVRSLRAHAAAAVVAS